MREKGVLTLKSKTGHVKNVTVKSPLSVAFLIHSREKSTLS